MAIFSFDKDLINSENNPSIIRAIQTKYKGYNFRSRLEARWAVFFDALGVTWEYEKEGYQLDSGWYLPDFWVEDWQCFLEVKGQQPAIDERNKCAELAHMLDQPVLLVTGPPGHKIEVYASDLSDGSAGTTWRDIEFIDRVNYSAADNAQEGRWFWFMKPDFLMMQTGMYCDKNRSKEWLSPNFQYPIPMLTTDDGWDGLYGVFGGAVTKSRSARFEHGESP